MSAVLSGAPRAEGELPVVRTHPLVLNAAAQRRRAAAAAVRVRGARHGRRVAVTRCRSLRVSYLRACGAR